MPITIMDPARKLNVSKTTVSCVLNDRKDPLISDSTRQRVMEAAQKMGYRPNRVARALATGRTYVVSLRTPNLYSPFYVQAIRYTESHLRASGYVMMASSSGTGDDCSGWPVDGILALDHARLMEFFIQENRLASVPLVNMGAGCIQYGGGMDCVDIDLYPASKEAVQHLVDSGRRRIIHLHTPGTDFEGDSRRTAYEEVMRNAGLESQLINMCCDEHDDLREISRRTVAQHVRAEGCPDGIFAANDEVALGAYRGLCDLGIRVPDDVALVGCDGIDDLKYLEVPLSTISLPVKEMCRTAWELLQRRMKDPSAPVQHVVLKPQLVIRESSRECSTSVRRW